MKSRHRPDAGVGAVISTVAPYVDRQSLLYGARPLLIVYFGYATFSCVTLSHKITMGLSYSEKKKSTTASVWTHLNELCQKADLNNTM